MLVRFTLDFKQIYKALDELLPESLSKFKKDDRAIAEILIIRAFIMTTLTNSLIEKKVAKQVLDMFHDIVFSAIEDSDLEIDKNGLPELLHDRYGEYYQLLDDFLGSKTDEGESKGGDRLSDSSFMFGAKIGAHIIGNKEDGTSINLGKDGRSELYCLDARIAVHCWAYFMSLYKAESEVFAGLKDQIMAGK